MALQGLLKGAFGAAKAFNKTVKAKGGFAKMAKRAAEKMKPGGAWSTFEKSENGLKYAANRDVGIKLLAATPKAAYSVGSMAGKKALGLGRLAKKGGSKVLAASRTSGGKAVTRGLFVAGATAMLGLHTMKGGMNQAKDIAHDRYMQDYTYSKGMLQNSRVGLASGTSSMLNKGGHQGLTTAMHKTRHGR